jgi:hypothetical protein
VRRAVGALGTACLLSLLTAPAGATVPPSALARAVAADEPVVGPEHPVSDPIEGAGFGWQSSPAIAFDGTNYLVVWRDSRTIGYTGYDIYGARVAPDGRVLDPVGIPIATAAGHETSPRVAFGGGTFLVVWSTAGAPEIENDVVGTRVTPSGSVLDPSGISIASTSRNELGADVAPASATTEPSSTSRASPSPRPRISKATSPPPADRARRGALRTRASCPRRRTGPTGCSCGTWLRSSPTAAGYCGIAWASA